MNDELNSSELGTLDYWEKFYDNELTNFEDHGDVGEVWFGQRNARSIIKFINEDLSLEKNKRILDLGCGNGFSLVELWKSGFTNLVGVDYSEKAVSLARKVLNGLNIDKTKVKVEVVDILDGDLSSMIGGFKLVHDKGTYDAISLNPENSKLQREKYVRNVRDLLDSSGILVISSCNWTADELKQHFISGFNVEKVLETPQMTFGGQIGKTVTNVILKKTL